MFLPEIFSRGPFASTFPLESPQVQTQETVTSPTNYWSIVISALLLESLQGLPSIGSLAASIPLLKSPWDPFMFFNGIFFV